MSLARTLLVAGALAFASPALAQTTTPSDACTTITQSAANAATSRVNADDTDIPKPQTVKNFTCLDKFFNGTGLNVVAKLHRERALHQADLGLERDDRQGSVRDHAHRLQDGLSRRQYARRWPILPENLDRRRRGHPLVDRRRPHE